MAMALSSLILLCLIICMGREELPGENQQPFDLSNSVQNWCVDEIFILVVVLILIMSMGSSSMVEEEQYIWHFVISTLFMLLLRKAVQSLPSGSARSSSKLSKGRKQRSNFHVCSIILLLVSGRILRAWHQGGVNWVYLPDISKWLEQAGNITVRSIQMGSGMLVISLGLFVLFFNGSRRKIVEVVGFCFLICGLLVLCYMIDIKDDALVSSGYDTAILARIIYAILGIATLGTVVAVPWLVPLCIPGTNSESSTSANFDVQCIFPVLEFRYSSYVIGMAYILCWCLLQLLLQQPINSMPVSLLLMQILAIMLYYSCSGMRHTEWMEVALLCYVGMTGHFALGNSNTLATIDVAGAFIGLSSHSTLLSGILMFIITYASPMLALLSMVMYISVKKTSFRSSPQNLSLGHLAKMMLGYPCLVPLGLNSILLTAYTVVLLLMRNHLFVWSVFSPKYMYVCATTVCIYIGVFVVAATGLYTFWVLALRRKRQISVSNSSGIG